ncbi:MAG: superoxide dismutase [Bacteroidales bacterium]
MTHTLPQLPFTREALEPHISARTLEFHHGKHHKAYVDKLNGLIPGTPYEDATLEEIITKAEGGIFNNGAQVWNHTFFWESLSPNGGGTPSGKLSDAIEEQFGSFEKFKDEFTKAAATLFGSGWCWLAMDPEGNLEIIPESNAGNPIRTGKKPLLTCDVWEHAYYLDYQNRRPDFLEAFWKVVDWKMVEERFEG